MRRNLPNSSQATCNYLEGRLEHQVRNVEDVWDEHEPNGTFGVKYWITPTPHPCTLPPPSKL